MDDKDEISIDFSKIKNLFKKGAKKNVPDQEIEVDSEKVRAFLSKAWPYLLILIPIFITIFVRAQTLNLTITDQWAKDSVNNYYRNEIATKIKQQNPNIPDQNLQSIIDKNLQESLKQNKDLIGQQVAQTSKQFKDFFQYSSGSHSYTYMGDIDSYYYLRQARNIVERGYNCDVIENGVCYDTYTMAPEKRVLTKNLHQYSIAWLYKILKIFNKDMTLMQAGMIVPTLFAVLCAVLLYIMMLNAFGPLAALSASILVSVHPIFLTRSLGSDSDIYNVFFPILIIFFATEAFISKNRKTRVILSAFAGLSIGAYSFAWIGWWYLFYFIVLAILADHFFWILKEYFKTKKLDFKHYFKGEKAKNNLAVLLPFVVVSLIVIPLITNFNMLSNLYTGPFGFTLSKSASNPDIWPNVLTTVAEFNEASIQNIIDQMYGKWYYFLALLGIISLIYKSLKNVVKNFIIFLISIFVIYYLSTTAGSGLHLMTYLFLLGALFLLGIYSLLRSQEENDIKLPVMYFLWVAASIYASTVGVRFTLLLVTPLMVGIGISFGFLQDILSRIIGKTFHMNKFIPRIILFFLFSYMLIMPVKIGINTGKSYIPTVNDQWWETLTKIKDNSKPDAIINSWWDFGHWFKYIADRRVTLDGSSQNNPQLHWLGKILLTSNELEAKGILRMVDCGGNMAFEEINKKMKSTPKSINLLNKIMLLEKDQAKEVLLDNSFSDKEAEAVLKLSHCSPPENFFVTSEDMVGKGGVWAHFGSWNFNRAWMHRTYDTGSRVDVIDKFIKELNISQTDADTFFSEISSLSDGDVNQWIAPWPSYMQVISGCQNKSGIVLCQFQQSQTVFGVLINLTTMDAVINTPQGLKKLDVLGYSTPTGFEINTYSKDTIGVGMVLLSTKSGYYSIFMSPQLVGSMFTRLYYLDGHGLKYFDAFHSSQDMNGFEIRVWTVNWEGRSEPIIVDRFVTD